MGFEASPSDLCSSLLGPLAPHRRSPGSPPPALGAQPARGEAEGAAGEEVRSLGLSAGSQAWKDSTGSKVSCQVTFTRKSTSQSDHFALNAESE